MKPKVFIAKYIPADLEERLSRSFDIVKWGKEEARTRENLKLHLQDCSGLVLMGGFAIDDDLLRAAPQLKVVSTISVGYDNFDTEAMKKHGVIGTHTPYVLDDSVADLAFTLILAAARRVAECDRLIRQGGWKKGIGTSHFGIEVHDKTLGIVGMGRIGEAVVRRARLGFNMRVLYHNRRPKPEIEKKLGISYAGMEKLLSESDFILLLVPLTAETYHLINEKAFQLMKKTAIFVNVSRGKTVDEQALIRALQSGTIRAAGLDVFTNEPIEADSPLLKLPNVVLTPHIGSATEETRYRMAETAVENLVKALNGETPPYVIGELSALVHK